VTLVCIQIRCERFPVLSETFVVNEARALARLGHRVEVFAHERPGEQPDPGADDLRVDYRSDESRAQRLRAVARLTRAHPLGVLRDLLARPRWRREEPVVPLRLLAPGLLRIGERHVHVHFARSSALDALRAHRILAGRFSLTAHAYDIYSAPANLAEKLRAAVVTTTGCAYTARELRAIAPGARIEVVVMGVDPETFSRRTPHGERRTVLAVGRLVEKKGFIHLIRAAAQPAVCGVLDELRIAGEGPLRGTLEAEIRSLGLEGTVHLVGALSPAEVRTELEAAAVLAMPSVIAADGDRDSMPVAVKEALAMEVPVVASDEVGLPEIIRPAFGRLVAPGDPPALGAALAELLCLPVAERAAMGRAGREHVLIHADLLRETGKLSALMSPRSG